jgi:hypothetical protein
VTLPRFHLFEFEDQPWLPDIVRDLATDYLCFIQSALGLHRPIVSVLADALRATGAREIVDRRTVNPFLPYLAINRCRVVATYRRAAVVSHSSTQFLYVSVKMLRAKKGPPKATGMKSSRCQAPKGKESLQIAVLHRRRERG